MRKIILDENERKAIKGIDVDSEIKTENHWKSWGEGDHSLCFIGFDNLFQNIKTTDNIPKTVEDYIWEYEHGDR